MGIPDLRIEIPFNAQEIVLLGENIIIKHKADGTTSKLLVLPMDDIEDLVIQARALDTLALESTTNKELAIATRDLALGIAPGQEPGMPGTVLYYIKSARDILMGVNKFNIHSLSVYGFDVARGSNKIVISKKADKLIELATKLLAKNTLDGVASPIKGLNITDFTAKNTIATTQHALAIQLNHDKIEANLNRDRLLGIDKKQKRGSPGTLKFYITSVRDVLMGIYKKNETTLVEWGFEVHHGPAPHPAPTTAICLTGRVTDNNNNPVNNATIKIVQLNVTVQSNSDGNYSVPMQAAGTYTIEVSKVNCLTKVFPSIIIASGIVTGLDVMLQVMSGSVIANVFYNGQPISGAVVAITEINLSATTDSSGIANLNNINPGSYNVLVTATGKAPLTMPVTVAVNTITSLNFNLVDQS